MTTIHHFERARFHVESKSGHEPYLVDLVECRRKGFCGCKGWEVRKTCEHVERLFKFLEQEVIQKSGISEWNKKALRRQVDRIIFRWQREEVKAELNPQRYGTR